MDELLDFLNVDFLHDHFLNVDFLHDHLPSSWFDGARQHFGTGLTDEKIVQSVQEASDFFNMNAPMSIHEAWTTGVLRGMTFTENDDILVFNRQQMLDMGITDKEGFDLVMTHEGAHRALQGMATGLDSHQEELCCDYMAGVRAGLNDMAEGKLEAALAGTAESPSHPDGAIRVQAIEAGVEYAHKCKEANGIPPTFSDCLKHFYQTTVYASTLPHESGHINLSPEHDLFYPDRLEDQEISEIYLDPYDDSSDVFIDDSHYVDEEHDDLKGLFIDNKSAQLKYAQEAKENAEWHDKRADDCIARGDLSGAKDHAARAASYRRAEQDAIAASKKCTK